MNVKNVYKWISGGGVEPGKPPLPKYGHAPLYDSGYATANIGIIVWAMYFISTVYARTYCFTYRYHFLVLFPGSVGYRACTATEVAAECRAPSRRPVVINVVVIKTEGTTSEAMTVAAVHMCCCDNGQRPLSPSAANVCFMCACMCVRVVRL